MDALLDSNGSDHDIIIGEITRLLLDNGANFYPDDIDIFRRRNYFEIATMIEEEMARREGEAVDASSHADQRDQNAMEED